MPSDIKIPDNSEIDKALKEFEMKSAGGQVQKNPETSKIPPVPQREVSGVKFETDSYKAVRFYDETDAPKIVQLVMKYSGGAIKEQKQAEYVLFGFVVLTIIISLFLFFGGGTSEPDLLLDDASVVFE